jgi:hypothetical protein
MRTEFGVSCVARRAEPGEGVVTKAGISNELRQNRAISAGGYRDRPRSFSGGEQAAGRKSEFARGAGTVPNSA